MQGFSLIQTLTQKLSPQQIQFIKLLQVPTAELDTRIEEELEKNPALEEGPEDSPEGTIDSGDGEETQIEAKEEEVNFDEYLQDDYAGYKMHGDGFNNGEEDRDMPVAMSTTLNDQLMAQLGLLGLDEKMQIIGKQLVGSIEGDGYIRRDLDSIVNDLAFSQNIETTYSEVEKVLIEIQAFDPPGIAARNLKECLLLQLDRKKDHDEIATLSGKILRQCFIDFTKKHYDKIRKKLNIEDEELFKKSIELITKLNPKPGGFASGEMLKTQYLIPDFIITNNNGILELSLNSKNAPELKVSRSFTEMMKTYDKTKKKDKKLRETASFVKQKLDAAKWFIDAIRQRQHTLLNTMRAIIDLQYDFFLSGDDSKLRPMILKDVAEKIEMDISTVSRVASSKSVQTEFGIYILKYFFSEGITTDSGEDVSSREVKGTLKEFIDKEDKKKPLSDDKLERLLKEKGYQIARRTVAKYRENMNIPVARLRKEL